MDRPIPVPDESRSRNARAAAPPDPARPLGPAGEAAGEDFFSYLSQEVQKPMSEIVGMIDLLNGTALTLEQNTYLAMIRHSSERLMTMLTNLIDISRIQSETLTLNAIDFDLRMMLQDISRQMSERATEKFLAYHCTVSPNLPSRFNGDPGRIRQILTSLLDNAFKYTTEGGVTLLVDVQPGCGDRTMVAFEVMDTGIGISESRRERLFASFSPSGPEGGRPSIRTGLGLSIARQLCELMGGHLRLESRLGEGCSVNFTICLAPPSAEDHIPTASGEELADLRVLVVDDSLAHRNTLERHLKALGCRTEGVPDGWRAIDALRKARASADPFQVAIVDTSLPDMSGEGIGEKIKRDPDLRGTRLIMTAVLGRRGDARRFQEIGFSAYLLKPLQPGQLIDSLRLVMGRSPASPSGDPQEIITRHTLMENRKNSIRILFIEPDPTMQAAGCGLLKNLGYHADPVQSREEAMLRMEYHAYDLVMAEMMLPELDGEEMIRRIRGSRGLATSPDVPVLCLVAAGPGPVAERAIRAGGDAILPKPFGADELERMIEPMLRPRPLSGDPDPSRIFDEKWIREQLGDRDEMVRALIKGFMERTPAHLRKLKEHTRAKNAERIQALGAILKGTSSAIGAHALYRIAFQIEAAGQNAAYSLMPGLIRKMETAFEELKAAMAASSLRIHTLPPEEAPVDMKVVLEIFNDNRELLGRFFKDFLVNSLITLEEIRKAVGEGEPDQVRRSAHKLKGSLRYLAAEKSIDCASRLEEMGREGRLEGVDEAFRDLAAAYEEVRRFISAMPDAAI